MKKLSSVLTHLMAQKNINSSELARKTGIGQPVIYRLMTGSTENPQILTLKPIADFFDVTVDQLLGSESLYSMKGRDNKKHRIINQKMGTAKTIASVLVNLFPALIDGYQKAASAKLISASIPAEVLPLLPLNVSNLLNCVIEAQNLLDDDGKK